MGASDLEQLEHILGYKFGDCSLLERAVTHRSWAHERVSPGRGRQARQLHNEALEFLGDSVLGLVVADYLCRAYPEATEGELSRMKHRLVSEPTLARISAQLTLGEFVRLGRGEAKSGGKGKRALLSDVLEAVIGAIFLDGGLEPVAAFVELALGEDLRQADPAAAAAADAKTMLQEKLQALQEPVPQYRVVETLGPPHRRTFHVELRWSGGCVRGEGHTIKAAEAAAAQFALEEMQATEAHRHRDS